MCMINPILSCRDTDPSTLTVTLSIQADRHLVMPVSDVSLDYSCVSPPRPHIRGLPQTGTNLLTGPYLFRFDVSHGNHTSLSTLVSLSYIMSG